MGSSEKNKRQWSRRLLRTFRRWMDYIIGPEHKKDLREVILYTNTAAGHRFDKFILGLIVLSVVVVILETTPEIPKKYMYILFGVEWVITLLFTVEYLLRIYVEKKPSRYVFSFYGIVDLLSFLPTYLSIFFFGTQHLLMIRVLRLLRIFRIFKLGHFVSEGGIVISALRASRVKIYVFLSFIVLMATLIGSMMYMVEHSHNPAFSSIPSGIYWAIVTITTVGYGDVIPVTTFGRFLSTAVMILGYGVLAVPTGIVTAEISNRVLDISQLSDTICRNCGYTRHRNEANFCYNCGVILKPVEEEEE